MKVNGFTLLEIMMAIAVFSIVTFVVAPSGAKIIKKNRIISEMNKTSSFIRYARFSAISMAETVTICPTIDFVHCQKRWRDGMMVFIDRNNDKKLSNDEKMLASDTFFQRFHKIKGANRPIVFYENGSNSTPATIIICPESNESEFAKAIFVSLQGRIRISFDKNNDGVDELSSNQNIDCMAI